LEAYCKGGQGPPRAVAPPKRKKKKKKKKKKEKKKKKKKKKKNFHMLYGRKLLYVKCMVWILFIICVFTKSYVLYSVHIQLHS